MSRWWILTVGALACTAGWAQEPEAPVAASERPALLVMKFRVSGIDDATRASIEDIAGDALAQTERFRVQTGSDLEELVALESSKAVMGCDDSECLREIAGALGARYVVTGRISKLGQLVVVKLSLLEPEKARTVSTETIEANGVERLVPEVRKAAGRMTARAFGEAISSDLEKSVVSTSPTPTDEDLGPEAEADEGNAFWAAVGWTGLGGMGLAALGVAGGIGTIAASIALLYATPTSPGLVKGIMRVGGNASILIIPGSVVLFLVSVVVATTGWVLE